MCPGALCAIVSIHYTKLWNKRYRLNLTQKSLCGIAALSTFFFAITFAGFASLTDTVGREIAAWEEQLKSNESFLHNTYRVAYYAVKGRNLEDFSDSPPPEDGGTRFPVTNDASRELAGEIYANEAYRNFGNQHPFLSLIILVKSKAASESVKRDMDRYFALNPNKPYSAETGVDLAAGIIREDLVQRSPRVVMIARVLLAAAVSVIQCISFGVIGLAAYRDLKVIT